MDERPGQDLCVLIANEPRDLRGLIRKLVETLGLHVLSPPPSAGADVAALIAGQAPDFALVCIGEDPRDALVLIDEIVTAAECPVIALLESPTPEAVREASRRGVFALITDRDGDDWASAIDVGLRRFGDFHDLETAFARRAVIERAKGILMERHSVDEASAFGLLRTRSRTTNRRLIDVAAAVADGHALLPGPRGEEAGSESGPEVGRDALSAPG